MARRVKLTNEAKIRIDAARFDRTEELRCRCSNRPTKQSQEPPIVSASSKPTIAALRDLVVQARRYARAQSELGAVPDLADMPVNYSALNFIHDRLARLDQKDAGIGDAVWVAGDCLKAGAGECLTKWEREFVVGIQEWDAISDRQGFILKRLLRKISDWADAAHTKQTTSRKPL